MSRRATDLRGNAVFGGVRNLGRVKALCSSTIDPLTESPRYHGILSKVPMAGMLGMFAPTSHS